MLLLIRIPYLDKPSIKIENFDGKINLYRECIYNYDAKTREYILEEKDRTLRIDLDIEMSKYSFYGIKNIMNCCTIFCDDGTRKFEFKNWKMTKNTNRSIYFEKIEG